MLTCHPRHGNEKMCAKFNLKDCILNRVCAFIVHGWLALFELRRWLLLGPLHPDNPL